MDIETALETCLMQYSPIRGKDLKIKLQQRGYSISKAQFYRYGVKLKKARKLEQVNGIWRCPQDVNPKSTGWNPLPKVEFNITQLRHSSRVTLPTVATNLVNWSPYQIGIRLKVWVLLGGRNLGLINDLKGYYNGKRLITVEPDGSGFGHGCFDVPSECVNSKEELSLSFVATIIDRNDPDKSAYKIVGSYTYRRQPNDWSYEPTLFINETQ